MKSMAHKPRKSVLYRLPYYFFWAVVLVVLFALIYFITWLTLGSV